MRVNWDPPETNFFLYPVVGYVLQSSIGKYIIVSVHPLDKTDSMPRFHVTRTQAPNSVFYLKKYLVTIF